MLDQLEGTPETYTPFENLDDHWRQKYSFGREAIMHLSHSYPATDSMTKDLIY